MSEQSRVIGAYIGIGSLLCQLILLALQARAYRRTGHSSLVILSIAAVSAVLYLVCAYAAALFASDVGVVLRLYWLMAILFTLQAVLGIWGVASLFRAFALSFTQKGIETHLAGPVRATLGVDEVPDLAAPAAVGRKSIALSQLTRLWTLRGIDNVATLTTERSVALLSIVSLALWLSIDRLQSDPGSSFDLFGLPSLGVIVLFYLGLAFVIARRSRPRLLFRQGLFLIVAVLPILLSLHALITHYFAARSMRVASGVLIVYALVYTWQSLRTLSGAVQPWAVLWTMVLLCGYAWLDGTVYLDPSLWTNPEPDSSIDPTWTASASESLLFDQQRRIDRALAAVAPHQGDKSEIYFVGFAGVASQRVFSDEIKLAARVIADRYDTAKRELLLINDRRDRDIYPLATVSGLRYALSGIARKMDLKRDILFLSLSSHGSSEPELSVSNGALNLDQVTGGNLAQALRESGIRWRIIVISACYAGAFIPALQDPGTIIITAAAANRTSFGCSDERELTYFGEAFYRDALPKAQSLEEAFSLAKAAIVRRETAEHMAPSNPQAYFGADIDRLLQQH